MEVSSLEWALLHGGCRLIAGCDEAGRGALAGPVVAAAVVLAYDHVPPLLQDSKRLTRKRRELLAGELKELAIGYATFAIEPREIERINILQASLKAMARCVQKLGFPVGCVLVDGPYPVERSALPGAPEIQPIVDGDAKVACIAAASVLAKVERDFIMAQHARRFPRYRFDQNMGYPTEAHLAALKKYGPCRLHRKNFKPVRESLEPMLFK